MKIRRYLEESPVFSIQVAYERIIPALNKRLKKNDLNLLQGLVLTALFFEGRRDVTPTQLAEMFETSRGNMSHIISHLEYKGWIRRVVHGKDARQFHIELKTEGRKKAVSVIRFYDEIQDHFEKQLGSQSCKKIVDGLRRMNLDFE